MTPEERAENRRCALVAAATIVAQDETLTPDERVDVTVGLAEQFLRWL